MGSSSSEGQKQGKRSFMASSNDCCRACFKAVTRTSTASEKPPEKKRAQTRQLSSSHSRDGEDSSTNLCRKKLSWQNDTSLTMEKNIEEIADIAVENVDHEISESINENEEMGGVKLELERIRSEDNSDWDLSDVPLLIRAAREGNIQATRDLLKIPDVDISAPARGGITALHVACIKGHAKIVEELLQLRKPGRSDKQSADQTLRLVRIRTEPEHFTALHMAACSSNERIVEVFWEFLKLLPEDTMKDVMNARDCVGRTPLYYAVLNDNLEVASMLLAWTFLDVNASDKDGFTALHVSSWRGNHKLVSMILAHAGKDEIGDIKSNPRANGTASTCKYLSGLEKTREDSDFLPRPALTAFTIKEEHNGVTPLHYAVEKSNADIVTILLSNPSVDIYMENDEHQTIFDVALAGKNEQILWELLDALTEPYDVWEMVRHHVSIRLTRNFKANDKTEDKKLNNCAELLKRAVEQENFEHIYFLLKTLEAKLSSMNQTLISDHSKSNVSLLHHAALAGLPKLVEVLSRIPIADINTPDNESQTPLHYAAVTGHDSVVHVLLKNSQCNLNAEDKYSRSALQLAVESGQKDVEKLLMDRTEVREYVDRFYKNREVFIDAANTMLLAAALIAGVTFAGWLQPPGGFTTYADLPIAGAPGNYESYAAVNDHISMRVFWVFNSMSFFCSIGTIIAGAGAVLPTLDAFIATEVKLVKRTLVATSTLLVFAVVFIVGAFASAGYASLPPFEKYMRSMTYTVIVGVMICLASMAWFLKRLYGIRPSWVRFLQERIRNKMRHRFSPAAHNRPKQVFKNPSRPSFHSSFPR